MRYLLLFSLCISVVFAELNASPAAGPYPDEIAGWSEATKTAQREAGRRLLADLAAGLAAGNQRIDIPRGDYRFAKNNGGRYPAHIVLPRGAADVTIDFNGSTLWFETEASGIVLGGAKNITLRNVFLDWDPLPFMQGTVVAIRPAEGTFDVKLDPGYERACAPLMAPVWRGRGLVFDHDTRELKTGQLGCEITFTWNDRQPDGSYRLRFHGFHGVPLQRSGIAVGDPYVVLMRMQRAVRLEGAESCTLEDVTLYSSPFIGFVQSSGGSPVFRRCNILRRPGTNRLLAGNADGINCDNLTRGPLIEQCRMETLGDDFVNVHGHLARVIWQESPDTLIATRMNRRATVGTPVTVEFLDRASMRPLGKRRATWTPADQTIDPARCLADLKHPWHSGDAAALAPGKTVPAVRLKLDAPIEITGDVIILCEAFSSPGAVIRDNDFKGSLARGLRLQSPHVRVEKNRVALTMGSAVSLVGHASYWGEGPYVYDALIRGNTFADNFLSGDGGQRGTVFIQEGSDYARTRLPHDIRIESNFFLRSGGPAIIARGVDDLTITGNAIDGYAMLPTTSPKTAEGTLGAAIILDSIRRLRLDQNTRLAPGPHAKGEPILHIAEVR